MGREGIVCVAVRLKAGDGQRYLGSHPTLLPMPSSPPQKKKDTYDAGKALMIEYLTCENEKGITGCGGRLESCSVRGEQIRRVGLGESESLGR